MKIAITPRRFAEIIFDMRELVTAAHVSCERWPEDVKEIDHLLSEISEKIEELGMATSDVRSALNYLSKCMEEY